MQVTGGALGLTGTARRPRPPSPSRVSCPWVGAVFRSATASLAGWLASLPHQAGARLFAMNDTEAGWRGWEITELHGGLGRSYRDPRFDLPSAMRALGPLGPETDPPKTVRPAESWDDVHGWPWDGEG